MIRGVSAKYAFRSLLRNSRRTILSVLGVGVGSALGLLAAAWIAGSTEMQVRAVAESNGGHLRVVPREWPDNRENSLRLAGADTAYEAVGRLPGVKATPRRARANGLLAFGTRTTGVEVLGVDPDVEKAANRIVLKGRIEGRYLEPDDPGAVVIGRVIAKRLDVELDDDLFVTLVGRDEIQSAMLRIVGILETGSRAIDAATCHVTLAELEKITGFTALGEIGILLEDYKRIEATQTALAPQLAPGDIVITWKEINPGVAGGVEGDKAFTRLLIGIIIIVVSLGIAAAQLTAVLERRTEFAILAALGMKGRHVIALIVIEALLIGFAGAVVALLLGGPLIHYLATEGVNLAGVMGEDLSFGDVLLDPYMRADFGPWLIIYALGLSIFATVAASIYPAWLATRVQPADALRMV